MFNDNNNFEQAIRNSSVPIASNETEEAEALGHRGILLNRSQLHAWIGTLITLFILNYKSHFCIS